MIQHRDNLPTGSKFAARLAAVERVVFQRQANLDSLNARYLDLIEFSIGIDIWDGLVHPDELTAKFRSEFERASARGVRGDMSIPGRIGRLREWARRTYIPPG